MGKYKTNTIIWTDIRNYENNYFLKINFKKKYVYRFKSYKNMQIYANMCHNIQIMVLGFRIIIKKKKFIGFFYKYK